MVSAWARGGRPPPGHVTFQKTAVHSPPVNTVIMGPRASTLSGRPWCRPGPAVAVHPLAWACNFSENGGPFGAREHRDHGSPSVDPFGPSMVPGWACAGRPPPGHVTFQKTAAHSVLVGTVIMGPRASTLSGRSWCRPGPAPAVRPLGM
jgi:hypothetical protein